MTVYHKHMTQRVPSDPYWKVNCAAYCGAMLANDSVLGGLQGITGKLIRSLTPEPIPDPNSPGLNHPQVKIALGKLRIPYYVKSGETWATLAKRVGRTGASRAHLSVDYDVLQAAGVACQSAGDFDHSILVINVDNGKVRASDPLCDVTKVYPEQVIREAAEVFGHKYGMAGGGIYYAVSRVIPEWEA